MRGRSSSTRKNFWVRFEEIVFGLNEPFSAYTIHLKYNDNYPNRELTLNEVRARLRILKVKREIKRIGGGSPAVYEVVR